MTSSKHSRGYALLIVMLVLALMSVGLGTLLYFLEASAQTTSSMLERRRVFYACDGIGRAATVLAQKYMTAAAPTTPSLIKSVCDEAGGGCCASATGAIGDCDNGTPPASTSRKTAFNSDPNGAGASALPFIVPPGFKVKEFQIASLAPSCTTDTDCVSGTCVKEGSAATGNCRTVAPLPNGPFQGMNARQDVIAIALRAEHTATTQFACKTRQTLTLGKIAMFQFFLFSDSKFTDWHPGPAMKATGRMHANGDLGIATGSPVSIERVTASGDIRCLDGSGNLDPGNCAAATARIANKLNPNFAIAADFTPFRRTNASWTQDALNDYGNGNAQDKAHGVPRLQLPVIGSPQVQRGWDASDAVIDNANVVAGVTVANSRLLVDPVRSADGADIRAQKFAFKADIRIINGVWYLKDPANENNWPGVAIWSDHGGTHNRTVADDFLGATETTSDVGQRALSTNATLGWAGRVPQRYSYYGTQLGTNTALAWDMDPNAAATLRPPQATRPVVSYGSLFRDSSISDASALWRPGVRSLKEGTAFSWCAAKPGGSTPTVDMIDALALDTAATPCPDFDADNDATSTGTGAAPVPTAGKERWSVGAGVVAAARSGFRNGYAEFFACTNNDDSQNDPVGCTSDRRLGNVLPINFDLAAFQEALGDHSNAGELGSFFCDPPATSCGAFMGRQFNGIVYIGAPYAGSENGYGANGGSNQPAVLPANNVDEPTHVDNSGAAKGRFKSDTGANIAWASADAATTAKILPVLLDADKGGRQEVRDDEVAALPFPLCSDAGDPTAPAPGTALTTRGYRFNRPSCAAATTTRINGVRVINARRVNSNTPPVAAVAVSEAGFIPAFPTAPVLTAAATGELPNGISIITNLPMYVVGDVNITSDAFNTDLTKPWVPVLIGGDVVHPLSNAWDDRNARWALSNGDQTRRAMVTRYYMEMLAGWGPTVAGSRSGGIHNFPRFLEDWGSRVAADCKGTGDFTVNCPAIILGSLVIGHNRVYALGKGPEATPGAIGRSPPRRDWGFDRHLEDLAKQPPGAPVFDVAAIQQWTRN